MGNVGYSASVYALQHSGLRSVLGSIEWIWCVWVGPSGEVFDYLVSHGRMKEIEARAKFRQVSVQHLLISPSGQTVYSNERNPMYELNANVYYEGRNASD